MVERRRFRDFDAEMVETLDEIALGYFEHEALGFVEFDLFA